MARTLLTQPVRLCNVTNHRTRFNSSISIKSFVLHRIWESLRSLFHHSNTKWTCPPAPPTATRSRSVQRELKPHRKYISALFETSLSPLVTGAQPETSDVLRGQHLELVDSISRRHKVGELSAVALQLYWTLYTGVLAFWASDKSPKQEDTLALLDQSLAMFVGWLRSESSEAD